MFYDTSNGLEGWVYNIKSVLRMIGKRWAKLMLLISCLTIEEEISFTYY